MSALPVPPNWAATLPVPAGSAPQPTATAAGAGAAVPASEHDALACGTRLDEFEIVRVLGAGGFGIVYLALDHVLLRYVAIKEYMPTALAGRGTGATVAVRSAALADTFAMGLESFFNEARMLAGFDHPSLVKVYRFWKANGTAYMVMPYYPGHTLKEARRAMRGAPDVAWLRAFIEPLLGALEVLHGQGVYHRDITPDNILLLPDGRPVLLDFGSARRVIGDRTQSLTAILKPNFAPVEQYADEDSMRQGPWTDLYSLGATAHFMLTGQSPTPAVVRAVRDALPALAAREGVLYPGVPQKFLAVLDWMLALAPDARPQSVAALRQAFGGGTVPALPAPPSPLISAPISVPIPAPTSASNAAAQPASHGAAGTGAAAAPGRGAATHTTAVASTDTDAAQAIGVRAPAPGNAPTAPTSAPTSAGAAAPAAATARNAPRGSPFSGAPAAGSSAPAASFLRPGRVAVFGALALAAALGWAALSRTSAPAAVVASAPIESIPATAPVAEPAAPRSDAIGAATPADAAQNQAVTPLRAAVVAAPTTTGATPAAASPNPTATALAAKRGAAAASRPAATVSRAAAARLAALATPTAAAREPAAAPAATDARSPPATDSQTARAAATPEAAPAGPAAACEGLNFFSRAVCVSRECQTPQWRSHPRCAEARRTEEQRQRRMDQ